MQNVKLLLIFFAGIAINIAGYWIAIWTKAPLFLDSTGTILSAAVLGPFLGALTGLVSNLLNGVMHNPVNIPFAIVNIYIGIITGLFVKKWGFSDLKKILLCALFLGVTCPLLGTIVAVFLFGGTTGGPVDILILTVMKSSGNKIFSSAFLARLPINIIDKLLSTGLVYLALLYMNKDWKGISAKNNE